MKLLIEKKQTEEKEINLPLFYISDRTSIKEGIAILDETNCLTFFTSDNYNSVESKLPSRITERELFLADENRCTEEEFFSLYNQVVESISFKPQLIEK